MLVRPPLVKAKQHRSIRVQDLTKIVMARTSLVLTEERLVPFKATGDVPDADNCPRALHRISPVGLTRHRLQTRLLSARSRLSNRLKVELPFALLVEHA